MSLIIARIVAGIAALAGAVVIALVDVEPPLSAALAALALLILGHLALSAWWRTGNTSTGGPPENQPEILRSAAQLAITTDGIVLGLLSVGKPEGLSLTTKVGASSLGLGVVAGVILFFLVAYDVPSNRQRTAAFLFNLVLWALSFGLLCIVSALWWDS